MQPFGNAWYAINFNTDQNKWSDDEQAKTSRDKISDFIDEAVNHYPIDKNNINLLGFSQGTILSYAVALSYPEKIKNVIALSGYINLDIISDGFQKKDLSHLSFYCSHGSVDQVIPVEWARRTPEILKKLNVDHVYEEFPVGHGVAPQNFYAFKNWLADKI
jgi:phospholipase/carboxylesterase